MPKQPSQATSPRLAAARIAGLYLAFAVMWIYASDNILALLIQDKDLLVQVATVKGVFYVVVTTGLLYMLLLYWNKRSLVEIEASLPAKPRGLIITFLALAMVVPFLAYFIIHTEGPRLQKRASDELATIAQLKSSQIEQWLAERRGDAEMLMDSENFIDEVDRWLHHGDGAAKIQIDRRLQAMKRAYDYQIKLLDAPEPPATLNPNQQATFKTALKMKQIPMGDLYRDTSGQVWLDLMVPLIIHGRTDKSVGVLMMSASMGEFLFPYIQTWPTLSPSAETLLFRKEGNNVLFLNELRHRKNTALTFRVPLNMADLPSAMAARYGNRPQAIEGRDYRGIPVFAAARPVTGTDWFLLAKVDRDEVLGPLNQLLTWVIAVSLVAVAVLAASVIMLWNQQQRAYRLELAAQAAEQDKVLRLFYELPFIGMAIISPTTRRWLHVNDRLCEILGFSRKELLGTSWEKLTHPADQATNRTLYQEIVAGKIDTYQMDKRFIRKDGCVVDTALDVKCVRNKDGTVRFLVATVQDITERKRAEAALRSSEERYRMLVEQSADGIFVSDAQGHYIDVNSSGCRMLGYTREELLTLSIPDVITPDEIPRIGREVARFAGGTVATSEWQFRRKDGSTFPGEIQGRQLPDGRLQAILRDITERKAAEEALRDSEADLNRAQAVGHIGSWRLDVRRNDLTWSAENHRIFEVPEGTPMTYEFFLSTVHPDDRAYVDRKWQAGLHGEPYDIEHRLLVNGKVKWVREKAELEFNANGELIGGFGTTQDITDIKQAELALHEADRRKDEFLALLAHELRNPMAVTTTAVYMLQDKGLEDPEMCRWATTTISSQTEHLKRMVDDLLDVARITQGKIILRKTRLELVQLLSSVGQANRALIGQRHQHLSINLPSSPLWVEADPARVTQIINNVLENASKFTPEGGSIALSLRHEGDEAVINIRDSGRGIAPDILPHVFETFAQGEVSLAREEGGLGLGLALVKNLTELHGGRVSAASEGLGKGTEIIVHLPAMAEVQDVTFSEDKATATKPGKRRILIAEDNPDAAEGLARVLQHAGHDVRVAEDGKAALAAAQSDLPEIAILDIGLPKIDGYALAHSLRSLPGGKRLLLIALTGYGQDKDLIQTKAAGFDYHLIKPANIERLLKIIATWTTRDKPNAARNVHEL